MREIKFRVWHAGQMLTQPINTPFAVSRLFGFLDAVGVHAFDNVMQFTGLHDKNGKEIYEGDVVKTSAGQGCVEWAEDTACLEVIDGVGSRSLYGYLKERNGVEVIGNRFETPQLVEGKGNG